jgi:hypothetical protein
MLRSPAVTRHGLRSIFLLGIGFWALSSALYAQFPWVGPRAFGMGGTEVAAVNDNTAAWANPAALGALKGWEIQAFGGFAAQNRNNLVGTITTLADLPFDEIANGSRPDLVPVLIGGVVNLARPGTAVVGSGGAGLIAS